MARLRVAVLISGRGSNLQALIDACSHSDFPAAIVAVISNKPDAFGLERARRAGLPALVVDHRGKTREAFEVELQQELQRSGAEFICLAGFMRLLTAGFVQNWSGRMINIHPSLLPAFKGVHVHEQALAAGVRFSGCTVHYVVPEMDAGPIIAQAVVPVAQDDNPDRLAERILAAEHRLYPQVLRWFAERRVVLEGGCVRIADGVMPAGALLNPSEPT